MHVHRYVVLVHRSYKPVLNWNKKRVGPVQDYVNCVVSAQYAFQHIFQELAWTRDTRFKLLKTGGKKRLIFELHFFNIIKLVQLDPLLHCADL